MISEVILARECPSFWRSMTPTMDGFIRRINAGLYERDFEPLRSQVVPARRAFVNEVAFDGFCRIGSLGKNFVPKDQMMQCLSEAANFILDNRSWIVGRPDELEDIAEYELEDALAQAKRIISRVCPSGFSQVQFRPLLKGCGKIDPSEGDIIYKNCLYEIKAGDRNFRSIDVKQVLTYLALNYASKQYSLSGVCLFNPRTGISFEISVDSLCFEVSGAGAADLFDRMKFVFSGLEISGARI